MNDAARWLDNRVFRQWDFRCAYCGRDLLGDVEVFASMVREHVRCKGAPGRGHAPGNLVPACAACDRLKADAIVGSVDEARRLIANRRAAAELVRQCVARNIRSGGP